ncbi:hypothetical protein P9112_009283 [Eukaryota sp. TZLM1-RC]
MKLSRSQRRQLQNSSPQMRSSLPIVFLNIYDLSPLNKYLRFLGLQILHTSIEVYGNDYNFVGGIGIVRTESRVAPFAGARFKRCIPLARTDLNPEEVEQIVCSLGGDFAGQAYNVVAFNCNHFSSALAYALCGVQIPRSINRLARCVKCLSCCIDLNRFSLSALTGENDLVDLDDVNLEEL